MAIHPAMQMNELLHAFGLEPEQHRIAAATLKIRPDSLLTLDVEYIITDEQLPAIATALVKYRLVHE